MKKNFKNYLLLGLMALTAAAFTACSDSSSDSPTPAPAPTPTPPSPDDPGKQVDKMLMGVVRDNNGNAIQGVTITSGTSFAMTNSLGMFSFKSVKANEGRIICNFQKDGYFSVTRSCDVNDGLTWEVSLIAKDDSHVAATTTFAPGIETSVNTTGGMTVTFPSGASFKDEATGTTYTGNIKAEMAYLDPDATNFSSLMPGGDLIAAGDDPQLLSYGMVSVNLTDEYGNGKYNLQEGTKATVTFPVPASFQGTALPASIPLWSFNEQTGLWEKEGEATLSSDKLSYTGTVSHFSWWNLDYPYKQGIVSGYVKTTAGDPVAGIPVHVGQLVKMTDEKGYYKTSVPADEQFDIYVELADYADGQSGKFGTDVNVPISLKLNKEEVRENVNINLGKLTEVKGTIRNADNSIPVAGFYISYAGKQTRVYITSNGTFKLYAPVGYTGPATVVATSASGKTVSKDITLTGTDISGISLTFDGVSDKGALMISFPEFHETYTIDLSKATASINPHGINVAKGADETDNTSFYFNAWPYDDGSTSFSMNASVGGRYLNFSQPIVSVFSYNEETLTFQISGDGFRYGKTPEGYDDYSVTEKFIYETNEITVSVVEFGQQYSNVLPKSLGFPSFTPQLDVPSFLVTYYSKSYIGKGGVFYYNGGEAEFNKLKAQAEASGLPLNTERSEDIPVQDWSTGDKDPKPGTLFMRYYYGGNKIIVIAYNNIIEAFDPSDPEAQWHLEEGMVPITVAVFDNIDEIDKIYQYVHIRY